LTSKRGGGGGGEGEAYHPYILVDWYFNLKIELLSEQDQENRERDEKPSSQN
jgi:hypothetical protein